MAHSGAVNRSIPALIRVRVVLSAVVRLGFYHLRFSLTRHCIERLSVGLILTAKWANKTYNLDYSGFYVWVCGEIEPSIGRLRPKYQANWVELDRFGSLVEFFRTFRFE